jgi:uncharacterized protein
MDPYRWWSSEPYLYGFDLFHAGFYWEAHAEWESLWHAHERTGDVAELLRSLIRIAAAGVKLRQGKLEHAKRHLTAAGTRLESLAGRHTGTCCGIDPSALSAMVVAAHGSATTIDELESSPLFAGVLPLDLAELSG